jgi:hypothetical protein
MADPNLPADLVAFLQRGKQPEYEAGLYEAGAITFVPLDELKVEFFAMTPTQLTNEPDRGHVTSCSSENLEGLFSMLPFGYRLTWGRFIELEDG